MQELRKHMDEAWASQMPFVVYHLPNDNEVSCFFPKDSELRHLQSYDESGFLFSPFEVNGKPVLFSEANSKVFKFELIDLEMLSQSKFRIKENPEEKDRYLKLLNDAINRIKAEEFKKIVASRKISAKYDLQNPAELLLKLIQFYPEAFTYVWFHPEVGLWAGASPETFAKTYRTQFKTMALAGTKRVDENREWTEKEKDEQQIVTDDIVNALKNHSESIQISDRKTDKAGELFHLRTDITATLEKSKLGDVLEELHPQQCLDDQEKDALEQRLAAYEAMKVGSQAPDITFTQYTYLPEGVTAKKLSDVKSDKYLIVFAAGWCPHCTTELPKVADAYPSLKAKGIEVVLVSLDETAQDFAQFAAPFPFISTTDLQKWDGQAVEDYQVYATPSYFMLDKDLKIVGKYSSFGGVLRD